jgi:hypothetical protein
MAETGRVVDKGVLLPLGVVGGLVVLLTGLWTATLVEKLGTTLSTEMLKLSYTVQRVEQRQEDLHEQLQRIAEDGVTDTEWELWLEQYRRRNPQADVPDRPK